MSRSMRTAQEILEERDSVQEQYDAIKSQIEFSETGHSFYKDDPTWLPRAKSALRAKGSYILKLCHELNKVNQANKQANINKALSQSQNFLKRFMRNAKVLLPQDAYLMVMLVTQKQQDEAEHGIGGEHE